MQFFDSETEDEEISALTAKIRCTLYLNIQPASGDLFSTVTTAVDSAALDHTWVLVASKGSSHDIGARTRPNEMLNLLQPRKRRRWLGKSDLRMRI